MRIPKQTPKRCRYMIPEGVCTAQLTMRQNRRIRQQLTTNGLNLSSLPFTAGRMFTCDRSRWLPAISCWQHGGPLLRETIYPDLLTLPRDQWEIVWTLWNDGTPVHDALDIARALS